ncbi:hypothetical protein MBLNU459_g6248t1 [Dothideomycetes sp. NU459]
MNLRIDTLVKLDGGRSQELGMFHLRMHDLKKREFSFRRYSRDSGKEVCHSIQKYEKSAIERRPNLPRSISSAFASFLPRSSTTSSLKRSDSGNSSVYSPTSTDFDEQRKGQGGAGKRHASIPIPTKTTKLEFSNYAQVDIKRRGVKGSKRYEFEYWATKYVWKRVVRQTSSSEAVSYHLYHAGDEKILAQIEPTPMSGREAQEERLRGGWVPPCEMWINDNRILSDRNEEADVIVASGLMALVDDCIRRRFSPKSTRQLLVPIPKFRVDMDYTSTKHFINDVLNRQPARRPSSTSAKTSATVLPPTKNALIGVWLMATGGRTAWSSTVEVNGTKHQARYWYDGSWINNAREDAAEVALQRMGVVSTPRTTQAHFRGALTA